MAEPEKSAPERPEVQEPEKSEDDRRAQAAAINRKRTLDDWEEKKKRWRSMGVPPALPAAGSSKAKK